MIHIITDESATVFLDGRPYLIAYDQPVYEPLCRAIRANNEGQVRDLLTAHERIQRLVDYFGDAKLIDGEVVDMGPENILVWDVLRPLKQGGDYITPLEKAERVLGI